MATKKKGYLKTAALLLVGIILIAFSFALWFYTLAPLVTFSTYNLRQTITQPKNPFPNLSHTAYVTVVNQTGITSNIARIAMKSEFAASISPAFVVMNASQTQRFTVLVLNGTLPYKFQWYLDNNPVPGATNSSWIYVATTSGTHTAYINVTDNTGANTISNIAKIAQPQFTATIAPYFAALNVSQTQLFTSKVINGTPPYTYQWYLDNNPIAEATSATLNYVKTEGTHTIYLNVTDKTDAIVISNVANVANHGFAVYILPSFVDLNTNQTQLFACTLINGTSPFTLQWYLDNNPVPGANSTTWEYTNTEGTHAVYLNTTDGTGAQAISNVAEIITISNIEKIVKPEFAASISPAFIIMNASQTKLFTSTVLKGAQPYTYQWYLDNNPVPGATSATWNYVKTEGTHTTYLNVTDSTGANTISNIAKIVRAGFAVSITPVFAAMNPSQMRLFTSRVINGTQPYTYQWYLDNNPVPGATSATWNYTKTEGTHLVYLNVTDNTGAHAISNIAKIIKPGFAVSIPTAFVVMNTNQTQQFFAAVVNGTGFYSYQWYLDNNPILGANRALLAYNSTTAGTHTVYVKVIDTGGASSNLIRIVKSGFAVSISPAFIAMNASQTQLFNSEVVGGIGPYTYQWYLDNTPVLNAINPEWNYTATTAGTHTVYLNVVDSNSLSVSSNVARITKPGFAVSISPAFIAMDVGQTQLFNSTIMGGTGNLTYQWYLDNKPVLGATKPAWNYTASFDTTSTSLVLYFGGIIFNQQPVNNRSRPVDHSFDLSIKIDATGPINVTVYKSDTPIFNAKTDATHKTMLINSTAGTHTIYANITDSTGARAISNIVRTPLRSAFGASISPAFIAMNASQTQLFNSEVVGGIGPYTYQWYLDNNPISGAADSSWSYTAQTAASHNVYVNITDSAGVHTISNVARITKPGFAVSISPAFIAMDVGQTQLFNSTIMGGTGNLTYQWYLDNKPVLGATKPAWNYTATAPFSTIIFSNIESLVSVSLSDAFTGGTTPYMIIQNLDLTSSVGISYQYSYRALFRDSTGVPLLFLIVGVIIVIFSAITLVGRFIKQHRGS